MKKLLIFICFLMRVYYVQGENMELTSSAFKHQGEIPSLYTCEGRNVNPPLHISNVPKEAKSLVLIMDDPDVPKSLRPDGMYDHWVVFNIAPSLKEIDEASTKPFGIQGVNTGGSLGYRGPCPPDREHRYFFKLYALDTALHLREGVTKKEVEAAMKGHIIAKTELMGRYDKLERRR